VYLNKSTAVYLAGSLLRDSVIFEIQGACRSSGVSSRLFLRDFCRSLCSCIVASRSEGSFFGRFLCAFLSTSNFAGVRGAPKIFLSDDCLIQKGHL